MAQEISSLRKALERSFHDLGLQKRLQVEQLTVSWPKVVGSTIAKISSPAQFRTGTLFIDVVDNVWMQELKFQEGELINRVNTVLGEILVHRLFFQLARTPLPLPTQAPEAAPSSQAVTPLDADQEQALERELASVRDPQLREVLKDFRRRLLQTRPAS